MQFLVVPETDPEIALLAGQATVVVALKSRVLTLYALRRGPTVAKTTKFVTLFTFPKKFVSVLPLRTTIESHTLT